MKRRYQKLLPTLFFACSSFVAFAQSTNKELDPGYYVVISAYAETKEDIALQYINKLKSDGYDASYGFNSSKGLYFVYLRYFDNLKESILDMQLTRRKGVFTDSWVRVVPGDIKVREQVAQVELQDQQKEPPVTAQQDVVKSEETKEEASDDIEVSEEEKLVQYDPMTLGNTEVFLSLFNAANNRIIDGEIEVIDTERSRLIQKVKGNEYMILPDPKNNSGQLTFIADVFGYRKIQHEINYKRPLSDTTRSYVDLMGTTFVLYFDMVRYRKGDIATLYNVYFYNDAAIMLPESRYQLNDLLALMNENKNYRVRLHGHTNGNYTGKIIAAGTSGNFFSITDDSKNSVGSAKRLSELRAQIIKDYMVENGVDASRIEIKAWGGNKPLYDKRGANAKKNVRVEVEVLQD